MSLWNWPDEKAQYVDMSICQIWEYENNWPFGSTVRDMSICDYCGRSDTTVMCCCTVASLWGYRHLQLSLSLSLCKYIYILTSLLRGLQGRPFPMQLHQWAKSTHSAISVTFEPIQQVRCLSRFRISEKMSIKFFLWLEAPFLPVWGWRRLKDILTKGYLNQSIS